MLATEIVILLFFRWRFGGMGAADVNAMIPITLTYTLFQLSIFYSVFLLSSIILKKVSKQGAPLFVAILGSYVMLIVSSIHL